MYLLDEENAGGVDVAAEGVTVQGYIQSHVILKLKSYLHTSHVAE